MNKLALAQQTEPQRPLTYGRLGGAQKAIGARVRIKSSSTNVQVSAKKGLYNFKQQ